MQVKIPKEKEAKFLYIGIALLLVLAAFLIIVIFAFPSVPTRRVATPSAPTPSINAEQIRNLLSAPASNKPAEVSKDTLNNLTGKNKPVVPTQDVMNMLSAPPQKK